MKQILVFLFIFAISRVDSACVSYQSKSNCLSSSDGCCWIETKFKGTSFKLCTEHYEHSSESQYSHIFTGSDFSDTKTECSEKINTCYSLNDEDYYTVTKSQCLSSSQDCCYAEMHSDFGYGMNQVDAMCYPNHFGTNKALENSINSETSYEGSSGKSSIKLKNAKCSVEKESFYSKCLEQNKEKNCLKAESNCCWIKTEVTMPLDDEGDSKSMKVSTNQCTFNFFKDATTFKDYLKSANDIVEESGSSLKYVVKCNQHDYALYDSTGNVVKDSGDPTITYDNDKTGEKGSKPLSKIVSNSGLIRLNSMFSFGLLGLILFF